jgi:hypothetical protein
MTEREASQHTYRVDLPNVKGTVEVCAGIITNASASLCRYVGARFEKFRVWAERQGGIVKRIGVY